MKKKLLSFMLAISVFAAQFCFITAYLPDASAETTGGVCGDNATWTLDTETKTLYIDGFGEMDDYNSINPPWVDYDYFIDEIIISEGITQIGKYSFFKMYLNKITIPSTVEIIQDSVFTFISGVNELVVPEDTKLREFNGFSSVTKTTWYNNLPDGPVYFGNLLCGYKGTMPENYCLEVEDGTYAVNKQAFINQTNLVDIIVPDSVIHMGEDALKNTGWYNAQSDGAVYAGKIFYEFRGEPLLADDTYTIAEGTVSIAPKAFYNKPYITDIYLPSTIKAIGARAFSMMGGMESVNFAEGCSLEFIGEEAFAYSQQFSSFNVEGIDTLFPESLVFVDDEAFRFSYKLKETVNIPAGMRYFGEKVFAGGAVTAYDVDENNKYYSGDEYNILYNKNKTVLVAAPRYFEIKEIVLPETVTEILSCAFIGSILNKVTLPDGIKELGEYTFQHSIIKEINLPYGIEILREFVFASNHIKELVLPSSITTIEGNACQWSQLQKIVIPKETVNIVGNPFKKANSSSPTLTIYCYENSAAHNTAVEYGIDYVLLDEVTFGSITATLEKAESVDRSLYTEDSLAALDEAVNAVNLDSIGVTQDQVNEWENAINNAIDSLRYKPADYSAVNEAIEKANEIDRTLYTAESLEKLDEAVAVVDKELDITNQTAVQEYADAITEAIGNLKYKPADYSAVNEAIEKANEIDRTLYTAESLANLNEAVAAVDKELDITNQTAVQEYADAITEAIGNLKYKPADYSAVNEAIEKANEIDRTLYTAESLEKLDEAVAAVDKELDITNQIAVQEYADAITEAIGNLKYKPADYSAVNEAIEKANGIDRTLYTAESLAKLDEAVAAVDETLDVSNQDLVTAYAKAINDAIDNLEYLPADYSKVNQATASAEKLDRIMYSQATLKILDQSMSAVDYNLNITQQSIVDGFADRIHSAISGLKYAEVVLENKPNGVLVSATAKEIYPTTALTVDMLDPSNYETANFAVGGYIKSVKYYDINLIRDGSKIQPDGTVSVKIKIPNGVKPEKCRVYHVTEDPVDPLVRFASTLDGNYIVFETDHFSEFAVIEVETYLSGVSITKTPSKLTYSLNEKLDLSGIEVTALMSDGKSLIVEDYDVSNVDTSSVGTKTVTVYYTFGENTKSASFEIAVTADKIAAIITLDGREVNEYTKKVAWYKGYSSESLQLECGLPASDDYNISWSSDNSKVLVDANGKVTNKGFFFPRKAVITVTVTDSAGNVISTDSITVRFYKFSFQLSGIQYIFQSLRKNEIFFL